MTAACGRFASAKAATALPVPPSGRLGFRILREDRQIGTHMLVFTAQGDTLRVDVAVDIAVSLGPIVIFRYLLRSSETWQGGELAAAEGRANDDGTVHDMTARRAADTLAVAGSDTPRYLAPAGAILATHWNAAEFANPMINPQGGKLLRPIVQALGTETIPVGGQPTRARRYNLSGDIRLDLWYDDSDQWCAGRFAAKDGSTVRYERL